MTAPIIESQPAGDPIDGSTETPPVVDDTPGENNVDDLPEWARESLSKANKEAADYRGKLRSQEDANKALEDALAKAVKAEDVQAAIAEAVAGYKDTIAKLEHAAMRTQAAREFNLPEALEARLQGSTLEELQADAKALSELMGQSAARNERLSGGRTPGNNAEEPFDPVAVARKLESAGTVVFR